jgi:fructokinase
MSAIVVCGEALMDVYALADTPTGLSLEARMGGSPFNVAVGLARLARSVAFFGSISRDLLGERLVRALREEGIDTSPVVRVDASTTLSFVGLDANGVPSYAFYGDGGADRQLAIDALSRVPPSAAAVHVGSFSTVVEPVASTLRALVETARHGVLISYDPNVRLNVQADLQPWRAALDWMLTRADIVKISAEDLALLWPGVPGSEFLDRAVASGVALAIITHGASGASAATPRTRIEVPARPVPVVDTVGAGDSFQAALLASLSSALALRRKALASITERELNATMRFACTAASLTCSRRGANLPTRDEVDLALAATDDS